MNTERDDELGAALRQLPVPDHQPAFWDDLERRLAGEQGVDELRTRRERRFPGPTLWILSAAAALALVVAAVAVLDRSPKTQVQVTDPSTTTTSTTPGQMVPTSVPPTTSTTALPVPAPPVGVEEFPGIYPVTTLEELERDLATTQFGRDSVVRQYLTDHGLTDVTLEPVEDAGAATVRYTAGSQSGIVRLQRVAENAYVVTGATTDQIQTVEFKRTGSRLDVSVEPAVAGEILAEVGPMRSEFTSRRTGRATPGTPTTLRLELPHATEPALLSVKLAGGFAAVRVNAEPPNPAGSGLGTGATLAADRLGPITIAMSFPAARAAAGVPVTQSLGTNCDSLVADGLPGVSFVRIGPDRAISLIVVNEGVRTSEGVGIGSTRADVVRSHGEPTLRSPTGSSPERLVYLGTGGQSGPGIRFDMVDGTVVTMVAGIGVDADELCG